VRKFSARSRLSARLGLLALIVVLVLSGQRASGSSAASPEPFLTPADLVVVNDQPVCSLMGDAMAAVGITGLDSGDLVIVDGVAYWTFGDTVATSGFYPNVIGTSTDSDPSDCIAITPKQQNGRPVPLIAPQGGELLVWPSGMEQTGPDTVHVYLDSVVSDPVRGWRVAGISLASFDTTGLQATRALGGALLWGEGTGFLARDPRTFADETYVYVFLTSSEPGVLATDVRLARVPKAQIESRAAYEYWQGEQGGTPGHWVGGLWNASTGQWDPALSEIAPLWTQALAHNGTSVAYNPFLKRWVAVYSSNIVTTVSARTAPAITGPWSSAEEVLVDCSKFHHAKPTFLCYSGAQHEFYMRAGGRTMYVSYSNTYEYEPFLHEVRLGAPVNQWSNASVATYYVGGAEEPSGYAKDGIAFYASDVPVPGFAPIHRWLHPTSGAVRLGVSAPAGPVTYSDGGVAFYTPRDRAAATATNTLYAPVYRWTKDGVDRYSPLNLEPAGYAPQEIPFYAACPDADGDRLTDCYESFPGLSSAGADYDDDLLTNGFEAATAGCDGVLPNDDLDGWSTTQELGSGTNPCVWDSGAWGCANAEWRDPGCDVDGDGDGCTNAWELGPVPSFGGQRDPADEWDYFNPTGDGRNRIDEVLVLITNYYTSPGDGRYQEAYDRTSVPSQPAWRPGGPDGRVLTEDILVMLKSLFHDCASS
jgi:hypothetical protein